MSHECFWGFYILPRVASIQLMQIVLCVLLLDGISDLIADLGDDDWKVRERATAELKKLGKRAEASLRELKTDDPEVAWRRKLILDHIACLQESKTLVTMVQVDAMLVGMRQVGSNTAEVAGNGFEGQVEEAGVSLRVVDGRRVRKPMLLPWDRIVRYGVRDGREIFLCVQRDRVWRHGDREVLHDVLRAEISKSFDSGVPHGLHLLARAPVFQALIPELTRRAETSKDPVVRRVCSNAIACQKGE